ncbi:Stp1/IreP family PP2C-type Ser/Thr phosphatase [Streptococcus ovuberis]|uniref:protein-serine/threonine phosphatase n=1 Tax=Streptococcus ovuberis TaxID=1936207 RepID=A0A7X6MWW5_9STRE|nr:Stp1/IreP family PP2C-type Ser/Thr phosphatase [Streptococcus ovuberis]NKZ19872.1 Stp1/IreP family PP2C-type Ser/Thr phosphatase [Streptococcus ovuberis]
MKISLLTNVGQKRSNNQDYVNVYTNKQGIQMIILADGMGGHRAGNIASELAATALGGAWVGTDLSDLNGVREWFIVHLEEVNQTIRAKGQEEAYQGMGTTIEAVVIIDQQMIFAHIGDSRIHLVRGEEILTLTNDHSLVNALLRAGQITPEEAAVHPQKNIITQSLGQRDPVEPDIAIKTLEVGDYLVINSDGLTNMVSQQDIYDIMVSEVSLDDKAETLIRFANNAGGLDNITVALVHIDQEGS